MRFKTLRHKEHHDTFGVFMTFDNGPEVAQTNVPDLMGKDATMEVLLEFNKGNSLVIEQLNDYDLVETSLFIIEK